MNAAAIDSPSLPDRVREDLLDALRRVRARDGRLCVDGVPVASAVSHPGSLPRAQPALAAALYTGWFAAWFPPSEAHGSRLANGQFFASLRAAHAAAACFEPGWVAAGAVSPYAIAAARGGETVFVEVRECLNLHRPGDAIRRGDAIAIRARRDVAAPRDGWWITWAAAGPAPEEAMLRLYWNCGPESVRPLIRGLTEAAGNARIRYTLKCPSAPLLFGRRDGTVLYLAKQDWPKLREPLRRLHRRTAASLDDATPPMTFRLGRGAALVEDPANGHSFGQTITWAVASGILEGLTLHEEDLEARLEIVVRHMRSLGISPAHPYAGTQPSEIEWSPW
ncbi:MAG: hypothetical protein IT169_02230 [Bryobacterales bacterium]|nr:hypothetical protein [Bryobacterales bacterium]